MTPPIRRRWPWFLLVGSLAVNMLAGGFAVAHMVRPPPPPGPEGALNRFIDHVSKDLPPGDADVLRRALDEARPLFVRMHTIRDEFGPRLRAELIASPFDLDRIRALFESGRAADDALRVEIDGRAIEVIKRLSPEARLRLAESRLP